MKYLLLFAVLLVAYLLWRNARLRDERPQPPKRPAPPAGGPQEMVSCPVCGVHLPRSVAVPGAGGILYGCHEHRLRAGG
jgi:uncharacterized protein